MKVNDINTLVEEECRTEVFYPWIDACNELSIYVELGTFVGGNLARVADRGRNKPIRFVGIDNYEFLNISGKAQKENDLQDHMDFELVCRNNLDSVNLKNVELIKSETNIAANLFDDQSIDCLFIDATHTVHDYHMNEFKIWVPKVKDGGIICGHDWPTQHIQSAVKEYFKGYDIKITSTNGAYYLIK